MIKNEDTYCTVQHKIVREIGAWEAVIYGTIANLLRKTNGYGNVSNQTLIDLIGKDKKSIYRWIDNLVKAGYLEKVGGKGRSNISIYYITKKGGNMTPFNEEKRGQIDTEKGANNTIKGGIMPPINKGENKEINKESGGDMHACAQSPTPFDTTTNLFENMKDFNLFWDAYPEAKDFAHEREACERVWSLINPEWQQKLIDQLARGQRWREHTGTERDNPIWYLRNYQGQDVQEELPYVTQGTAKFSKWIDDAKCKGIQVVMVRYEDKLRHCYKSDLQTMIDAGAQYIGEFKI